MIVILPEWEKSVRDAPKRFRNQYIKQFSYLVVLIEFLHYRLNTRGLRSIKTARRQSPDIHKTFVGETIVAGQARFFVNDGSQTRISEHDKSRADDLDISSLCVVAEEMTLRTRLCSSFEVAYSGHCAQGRRPWPTATASGPISTVGR
ncbi:hypothetical protein [Ensifer canadensis]